MLISTRLVCYSSTHRWLFWLICEHEASYVFGWRQVALSMQLVMYFIYLSIEHVASYVFGWRQVALTMQPVFYLLAAHQSSGIRSCWHELFTWLLVLLVAAVAVFTQSSCHVPSYLHFFWFCYLQGACWYHCNLMVGVHSCYSETRYVTTFTKYIC